MGSPSLHPMDNKEVDCGKPPYDEKASFIRSNENIDFNNSNYFVMMGIDMVISYYSNEWAFPRGLSFFHTSGRTYL